MSIRISINHGLLLAALLLSPGGADLVHSAESKVSDRGIHRIWGSRSLDAVEHVRGGFVIVEWADVNPRPGEFDFSEFDTQLARYEALGKRAQVAIRGGDKPNYLFDEIPYHPEALDWGVNDVQGSLQYWHPTHRMRYWQLLEAFADYLRNSRYRDIVYSIRMNLNALGTEATKVDEAARVRSNWIVPAGVDFVPYSDALAEDYKEFVADSYLDLFATDFLLFVRSNLLLSDSPSISDRVLEAIEQGRVGLVHTGSVPEPTSRSTEKKYEVHLEYGRYGRTPVYAEPFSSSTKGSRGDQPGPQWNYWRILSDLHVGVSYVAVYGSDIERHTDPEYQSAFVFGNRYAGYQTEASKRYSPGAWIALREGDEYLLGDYSFLMTRMPGDNNSALRGVGPNDQRFGAWARRISSGGRMRLQLDDEFATTAGDHEMTLRVTFLNSGDPDFTVRVGGGEANSIRGGNNGRWKTVQFPVSAAGLAGNQGADITISADSAVTLHMIELVRSDVLSGGIRKPGVPPGLTAGN